MEREGSADKNRMSQYVSLVLSTNENCVSTDFIEFSKEVDSNL